MTSPKAGSNHLIVDGEGAPMLEAFVEAYPRMRARVEAEAVVRGGKRHLRDPTRGPSAAHYFRRLTPEELVRQTLVRYLTEVAGIPVSALDTEVNLKRLGAPSGGHRRTDLVISSGGR